MRITTLMIFATIILSGCLFQYDSPPKEVNYLDGYYLSEDLNSVDLTIGPLKDGAVSVVAQDVDSIGHSMSYILGFAKGKYFLIQRHSKRDLHWFDSRQDISNKHKDIPEEIPIRHVSEIVDPKPVIDTPDLKPVE